MADIRWEPIGKLGAKVDFDLASVASGSPLAELSALLDRHGLLLFERQTLTYDQQVDISAWFGNAKREKAPGILSPDPDAGRLDCFINRRFPAVCDCETNQ